MIARKYRNVGRMILIGILCFLCETRTFAQGLIQGAQVWSLNTLKGPIDQAGRWDYYLEVQPRIDLEDQERTRILLRPAVIFNLDADQSLWAGVLDLRDAEFDHQEFRTWEQYQRNDKIEGVILLNRTRFEERIKSGESNIGLRLRHMLRAQIPFSEHKNWSVVVFDEIFLGLNQNASQAVQGFDQNRLFGGFRVDLRPDTRLEFGYMNQITGNRMNHIPFISAGKVISR